MLRQSEAVRAGVGSRTLYRLVEQGVVEQVGHGLYRRSDALAADLDLLEVALRSARATTCAGTATIASRSTLANQPTGPMSSTPLSRRPRWAPSRDASAWTSAAMVRATIRVERNIETSCGVGLSSAAGATTYHR